MVNRSLARHLWIPFWLGLAMAPVAGAVADTSGPISTAETGARCIGPTFDDTAAFQAAIDTGRTIYAPALGGSCHITRPLVMKTPGQSCRCSIYMPAYRGLPKRCIGGAPAADTRT